MNTTTNTTISNVTITFPQGFRSYSHQPMTVACTLAGLADGMTPGVTFPGQDASTAMQPTGKGTWSAVNTDTYAAETYSIAIAGTPVSFSVGDDGSVSGITIA